MTKTPLTVNEDDAFNQALNRVSDQLAALSTAMNEMFEAEKQDITYRAHQVRKARE